MGLECVYTSTNLQTLLNSFASRPRIYKAEQQPFPSAREFTIMFHSVVYIPPQAHAKLELAKLHKVTNDVQNSHPDAGIHYSVGLYCQP